MAKLIPMDLAAGAELYYKHRKDSVSEGTLLRDRLVLGQLITVCGPRFPIKDLSEEHIDEYFAAYGTSRSRSDNNTFATFNKFIGLAKRRGWLDHTADPVGDRKRRKSIPRDRLYIAMAEFPRVLDVAEARHRRDRAFLATGLGTLGRAMEVVNLAIHDVDLSEEFIAAKIYKTRKFARKPISEEFRDELRSWLTYYANEAMDLGLGPLQGHWYLLPGFGSSRQTNDRDPKTGRYLPDAVDRKKPLNPLCRVAKPHALIQDVLEAAGYMVRDPVTNAGLYEGEHTIRRSGARALWQSLVMQGHHDPIKVVQTMLTHQTREQTEFYIGVDQFQWELERTIKGRKMYAVGRAGVPNLEVVRSARRTNESV